MTAPERGAIRQALTGMEGYCYLCARTEPPEECWWPLTREFFPVKRGPSRLVRFEKFCIACAKERQAAANARYRERVAQQAAA